MRTGVQSRFVTRSTNSSSVLLPDSDPFVSIHSFMRAAHDELYERNLDNTADVVDFHTNPYTLVWSGTVLRLTWLGEVVKLYSQPG